MSAPDRTKRRRTKAADPDDATRKAATRRFAPFDEGSVERKFQDILAQPPPVPNSKVMTHIMQSSSDIELFRIVLMLCAPIYGRKKLQSARIPRTWIYKHFHHVRDERYETFCWQVLGKNHRALPCGLTHPSAEDALSCVISAAPILKEYFEGVWIYATTLADLSETLVLAHWKEILSPMLLDGTVEAYLPNRAELYRALGKNGEIFHASENHIYHEELCAIVANTRATLQQKWAEQQRWKMSALCIAGKIMAQNGGHLPGAPVQILEVQFNRVTVTYRQDLYNSREITLNRFKKVEMGDGDLWFGAYPSINGGIRLGSRYIMLINLTNSTTLFEILFTFFPPCIASIMLGCLGCFRFFIEDF
jgi:hypothetical protein